MDNVGCALEIEYQYQTSHLRQLKGLREILAVARSIQWRRSSKKNESGGLG
jgi:hypothetical protein